jgi:microcystin-dependent protein
MSDCTQCDPCETEIPQVCEALPLSESPQRIIVESENFCKESIAQPVNTSALYFDGGKSQWADGSIGKALNLPLLKKRTVDLSQQIGGVDGSGEWNRWSPAIAGNNFILYWDGTEFTLDTLPSFFPSGDGLFVKQQNSISFIDGTNGQYLYNENNQLSFQTRDIASPPSGSIACFAGTIIPAGWILCDGFAYGRTNIDPSPQPTLFSIIGTTYGSGDGLTTFNIPDLRGVFVRGLDSGRGIDPFRANGSQQGHSFQSHNHGGASGTESSHTHGITATTGNESNTHTHQWIRDLIGTTSFLSSDSPYVAKNGNPAFSESFLLQYELKGSSTLPTLGLTSNPSSSHIHSLSGTTSSGTSHDHTINSHGTTETRPINFALNWIIKT